MCHQKLLSNISRVRYCLNCWAKCVKNEFNGVSKHEIEVANKTGMAFDSLRDIHKWAIKKKCGVNTSMTFENVDLMSVTIAAEMELDNRIQEIIEKEQVFK